MAVFCLIVFDSILMDFYKFFEFIGAICSKKFSKEKIIRTHYLSSYYCHLVRRAAHARRTIFLSLYRLRGGVPFGTLLFNRRTVACVGGDGNRRIVEI